MNGGQRSNEVNANSSITANVQIPRGYKAAAFLKAFLVLFHLAKEVPTHNVMMAGAAAWENSSHKKGVCISCDRQAYVHSAHTHGRASELPGVFPGFDCCMGTSSSCNGSQQDGPIERKAHQILSPQTDHFWLQQTAPAAPLGLESLENGHQWTHPGRNPMWPATVARIASTSGGACTVTIAHHRRKHSKKHAFNFTSNISFPFSMTAFYNPNPLLVFIT